MKDTSIKTDFVERLPWHKPELSRLELSVNTRGQEQAAAQKLASYDDGEILGPGGYLPGPA